MNKIRYLTILSHEGTTIYHYRFDGNVMKDELDIHLFTAFSSAILSITQEMEDELISINMQKQKIFFQKVDAGVFVLSVDRKANYNFVTKRLRMLRRSEPIQLLLADLDVGMMISISEELDNEIETIFEIEQSPKIATPLIDVSNDMLLQALEELESI